MIVEFYVGFPDLTWGLFKANVEEHDMVESSNLHYIGLEQAEKHFPGREISFVGVYNEQDEEE